MGRKRTIERRKHRRYKAVDGAFAAISPNSHKIGQILDIGMGGLCFKYIDNDNVSHEDGTDERIFLSSMGFYVGDLPFKTISDYSVDDTPSFNGMKIRKRHIQFTDLSFKQLFDLDCYLRNNVSEPVESLSDRYRS